MEREKPERAVMWGRALGPGAIYICLVIDVITST
jgi:hypothetical protein